MDKTKKLLANSWLTALIAIQPVLDAVAYFTAGPGATVAGYIRLAIMVALPLFLLISLKEKKRFIITMSVIAIYCALHVANCFRVGYISISFDVAYLARVVQMPILAICFMQFMHRESTNQQAERGMLLAAMIYILLLSAAVVSGTGNSTYGDGIGISGWVISDNRTANSLILITLCAFCMYVAAKTEKKYAQVIIPVMVLVLLLTNGTKSCYASDFVFFMGYAIFLVLEKLICKRPAKLLLILVLLALMLASYFAYPYTPRAKVDELQAKSSDIVQQRFDKELALAGYNRQMSMDEVLNTPEIRIVFEKYYNMLLRYKIPDLMERYDFAQILEKYKMTTSVARLDETRVEKVIYASLRFDDCDLPTKLVGMEVSGVAMGTGYDLENDWPALFFYYGYLGAALYGAFVLWFFCLVIKRLICDFKGSLTALNFTLLVVLMLQIGLAQYSGALLRRPNVSIYMSIVLALIYYQTSLAPIEGRKLNA